MGKKFVSNRIWVFLRQQPGRGVLFAAAEEGMALADERGHVVRGDRPLVRVASNRSPERPSCGDRYGRRTLQLTLPGGAVGARPAFDRIGDRTADSRVVIPSSVPLVNLHLIDDVPDGLTRRARSFVSAHGVKVDVRPVAEHRQWWLDREIPVAVIDRMAACQEPWGGLLLPPASRYDGGPKYFDTDSPEGSPSEGWWFEAGTQRTAVPYSFMIGPAGEFGIRADRWTPLHATVEGWVESIALTYHASRRAKHITKATGDDVDRIALDTYEPVREVRGLADTWWRGRDSLVAICSGEAECLAFPNP